MSYRLSNYAGMIRDRQRTDAYAEALRRTVRPDSVVLDIGTGAGILALLACRCGARRVYAVEPNDIIHLAREIATANGYADRITFIQGMSTTIALPEPADVIVADLRGVLPLYRQHLPALIDARERLLAPGGTLIPRRDTLWAAVVEAPEVYRQYVSPWDERPYGFDMDAARQVMVNRWGQGPVVPAQFLAEPAAWATLDYAAIAGPDVSAAITWTAGRPGTGHGLSVWFDAQLVEGVGYTTAPGAPETVYGSCFFPWLEPVVLAPGDQVTMALWARLSGDDYVWHWHTRIVPSAAGGRASAEFTQSTALGAPLPPRWLQTEP